MKTHHPERPKTTPPALSPYVEAKTITKPYGEPLLRVVDRAVMSDPDPVVASDTVAENLAAGPALSDARRSGGRTQIIAMEQHRKVNYTTGSRTSSPGHLARGEWGHQISACGIGF